MINIYKNTPDGDGSDVLVFLTGQDEIENLASLLKRYLEDLKNDDNNSTDNNYNNNSKTTGDIVQNIKGIGTSIDSGHSLIVNGVLICVLYASLPPEQQMLAFRPKPEGCSRKVILATNIAGKLCSVCSIPTRRFLLHVIHRPKLEQYTELISQYFHNFLETSVTLDGIRYVIDCGKHKSREYKSSTGMESLVVSDISKAQAAQRMGRAGRVAEGICLRLYPKTSYDHLADTTVPEILRVNLAQVVLQLKGMGIHDPRSFSFLTPPSSESISKAFEILVALGAIDKSMNLTKYGKEMAQLPLDPIYANLLLQSAKFECVFEILTVVAMLSAESIFYHPARGGGDDQGGLAARGAAAHRRFASYEGDLPTLLNVYNAWRKEALYSRLGNTRNAKKQKHSSGKNTSAAKLSHNEWCMQNFINGRALTRAHDVRSQLTELCSRVGMDVNTSCSSEMTIFYRCICAGLFLQVATRLPNPGQLPEKKNYRHKGSGMIPSRGHYKTKIGGTIVSIHPSSSLFGRNPAPKCVVYTDLLYTTRLYIRGATQIREEWLNDVPLNLA